MYIYITDNEGQLMVHVPKPERRKKKRINKYKRESNLEMFFDIPVPEPDLSITGEIVDALIGLNDIEGKRAQKFSRKFKHSLKLIDLYSSDDPLENLDGLETAEDRYLASAIFSLRNTLAFTVIKTIVEMLLRLSMDHPTGIFHVVRER